MVRLMVERKQSAAMTSYADYHWNEWLTALEFSGVDWMAKACQERMRTSMQAMALLIDPFAIQPEPMSDYYFEEYSDKLDELKSTTN